MPKIPRTFNEEGEPVNIFAEMGRRKSARKAETSRANGKLGGYQAWSPESKAKRQNKPVTNPSVPATKRISGKLTAQDFLG